MTFKVQVVTLLDGGEASLREVAGSEGDELTPSAWADRLQTARAFGKAFKKRWLSGR